MILNLLKILPFPVAVFCVAVILCAPVQTVTLLDIAPESGKAYSARLSPLEWPWSVVYKSGGDDAQAQSSLRLYEDGLELGPPHALHQHIRDAGNGAYSHWHGSVLFSTQDGSDPRYNGKTYAASEKMTHRLRVPLLLALSLALLGMIHRKKIEHALAGFFAAFAMRTRPKILDALFVALICLFSLLSFPKGDPRAPDSFFNVEPDTHAYTYLSLSDPWSTIRSPGYPLFLHPFLDGSKDKLTETLLEGNARYSYEELFYQGELEKLFEDAGLGGRLALIALAQVLIQAASCACLWFAFSRWFSRLVSAMVLVLSFQLVPLADPLTLMPESLAQPMLFCMLSGVLLFIRRLRWGYFIFACAAATCAFLIRPACVFALPICGTVLLWGLWRQRTILRRIMPSAAASVLLLGISVMYVAQISIAAGAFFPGTLSHYANNMFSLFFVEKEDLELMPTERSRQFISAYLDGKHLFEQSLLKEWPDFDSWPEKHSLEYRFNLLCWPYAYQYAEGVVLPDLGWNLSILERNHLAREIKRGVMQRHSLDYWTIAVLGMKASLGQSADYHVSHLANNLGSYLYRVGGLCLVVGLIFGARAARPPVLLLASCHILHIAACSFGAFILIRYVALAEPFMSMAILLALCSIISKGAELLRIRVVIGRRVL